VKVGEGLKKVTVHLVDGKVEVHEENESGDDLTATVQAGMYVVGDRVQVVETANGYFRAGEGKNKNVIAGPERAMIFERVVYGLNSILKVEVEMDEIGYDIGLTIVGKN